MDHYAVLDVPPGASPAQIKAAYRILVHLLHPDRLQQAPPQVRQYAEERLKQVNAAYAVLNDPQRRAHYDAAHRRREPDEDEPRAAPAYRRPRRTRARSPDDDVTEWLRQQAEREAMERADAHARQRQQEKEREYHEAELRARRAAETQFPRVRKQDNDLAVLLAPSVWLPFVHIPAGEFWMGADPAQDSDASRDEQPRHRIYLSDFYIAKYPVTNAHYQIFARAVRQNWSMPLGKETHPVVNVSWDDAVAFCRWLSQAAGRAFRLPAEAEWEKAARGTEARKYPWGDEWNIAYANGDGRVGDTTPVGQYTPGGDSPYGLADMTGNVWEWCADWYDPQIYARRVGRLVKDPRGPESGQGGVVRGGAFDSAPKQLRCTRRQWHYPDTPRPNVGFRIAVTPF